MLHEVLFALHGYPGCLFVEKDPCHYEVMKNLTFLHPSEAAILDRLCKIVSNHKFIRTFMEKHGSVVAAVVEESSKGSSPKSSGLYLCALCRGLDRVLEPYRRLLLSMEEEILKNPHLPLSYMQKPLQDYHLLFPALVCLLEDINATNVRGCHVLDILHKHVASGIPCVQKAMKKIMHMCHSVMFKQLSGWLLYGLITDPHKEFFIQQTTPPEPKVTSTSAGTATSCDGGNQLLGEYFLQPDMLPVYISTSLAEKICFVGESIQLLECKDNKKQPLQHKGFVLPQKREFALKFHAMEEKEEFDYRQFEAVIDEVRKCVAEQLWTLVVKVVDLSGHLHCIKDFYLVGRGELFQAFIDQAGALLQQPVTTTTEHNVNVAFQGAARSVLLEDDSLLEKFHFVVKAERDESSTDLVEFYTKGSAAIGWNNISLKYDVPWPLQIVFTKPVLDNYNAIFRFLLHIKRVQLELQHCWTLQMQWKQHYEESYPPAWNLRNLMSFIVNNLQYYLQVDVLESQFSMLTDKMDATRDFEAIKHAHEQFVVSLLAQTFLSSKVIGQRVSELLDLCLSFSQQFQNVASVPPQLMDASAATQLTVFSGKVADIEREFKRHATLLFHVLSSVHTYQGTPFVAQLLLRLDFNKFFSTGQFSS